METRGRALLVALLLLAGAAGAVLLSEGRGPGRFAAFQVGFHAG